MVKKFQSIIENIVDRDISLTDVFAYFEKFDKERQMLIAISFKFENTLLQIKAEDDDSISIHSENQFDCEKNIYQFDLANLEFWKAYLGKPLLWSWTMFNNFGYFDGIQLEFVESTKIQLLACGSEIKINCVIAPSTNVLGV
ncbi:DUF6334 family protein [Candidatus Uabimicrobium sp. HlEnr_7]|uniref:DUF6334 family protein n=1 Tax=Candidatus Uabimicrobium helgolandensis TaxID=3095367 RepID=UPI00355616E9